MSKTYRNVRQDETSAEYRRRESLRQSKLWAKLALDSLNAGRMSDAKRRLNEAQGYWQTYASLTPEAQTFGGDN